VLVHFTNKIRDARSTKHKTSNGYETIQISGYLTMVQLQMASNEIHTASFAKAAVLCESFFCFPLQSIIPPLLLTHITPPTVV
jgi:hypothetical protein